MPSEDELSRTLSRLLRYEATKYRLNQDVAGWVEMEELRCKCQIPGSVEDILRVASTSMGRQGRRFEVDRPKGGPIRLRATYAHGRPTAAAASQEAHVRDAKWGAWPESHHASKLKVSRESQKDGRIGSADPNWDPWKEAASAHTSQGQRRGAQRTQKTREEAQCQEVSQETWQKFAHPDSGRLWLFCPETGEFFFEDTAEEHGWTMYNSEKGPWWFHTCGRFFFDPP
ncbi:unnamed protein product [Symbiodinium natans]|uniref:2'-phosphotransferase n=1 Tax=Symbiodinium natans TaxID=878477 RepID=A0A812RV32_9DINO|nr:unnamed protein product [Symbiodinium natans]